MHLHRVRRLQAILAMIAFCLFPASGVFAQGLVQTTIYIQNPTSQTVNFSYRKGGDDWQKLHIDSGHTLTMNGIAPHLINFSNGVGSGRTQYKLTPGSTNYFQWSGGKLDLLHR